MCINHYNPDSPRLISKEDLDSMLSIQDSMADKLLQGNLSGSTPHKPLSLYIAKQFSKVLSGVDIDSQYNRSKLQLDAHIFAQLKSLHLANEADLIRSKVGNRPELIKTEFDHLFARYMGPWLDTELQSLESVANATQLWQQIEDNHQTFGLIKYFTARDERVRDSHRLLDGTVKKWDDPFWNTYMPPNGFNCRCFVTQDFEGDIKNGAADLPLPDPGFRRNAGREATTFGSPTKGEQHPYFNLKFYDKSMVPANKEILRSFNFLEGFARNADVNKLKVHPLSSATTYEKGVAVQLATIAPVKLIPAVSNLAGFLNVPVLYRGVPMAFKRRSNLATGSYLKSAFIPGAWYDAVYLNFEVTEVAQIISWLKSDQAIERLSAFKYAAISIGGQLFELKLTGDLNEGINQFIAKLL